MHLPLLFVIALANPFRGGVAHLGHHARGLILENANRLALHLDVDGTLTSVGSKIDDRAIMLVSKLQDNGVPILCNTAQSYDYLLGIGGGVFKCTSNELGLRVMLSDGSVREEAPPDFKEELEAVQDFLRRRSTYNLRVVKKVGGFAVQLSDKDNRLARPNQVTELLEFIIPLVVDHSELTWVQTDGFIDVCSKKLSKRYGSEIIKEDPLFRDCFHIGFGDGATDEEMFEAMDLPVKVGKEKTRADVRLPGHEEVLDVLQFIHEIRELSCMK